MLKIRLFVVLAALLYSSALWAQTGKTVADVLGVTHVSGRYRFATDTVNHFLKEGADKIQALGSSMIKLWFTARPENNYPFNSNWPAVSTLHSLTDLIKTDYYQNVITRPQFKTIILEATEFNWNGSGPAGIKWKDGVTTVERDKIVKEFRDLTIYLRNNTALSGKTFVLQNWEGDNALNFDGPGGERRSYQDSCIAGMIDWFNARQDGISQGRDSTPNSSVMVAGAAEFNHIPAAGNVFPYKTGIDYVVPYLHMDLYSYSCWTPASPHEWKMPLLLDYIRQRTPSSAYYGSDNIYLGEFGDREMSFGSGYIDAHTGASDNAQRKSVGNQLEQALKWGVKWIVYWQIYCNGFRANETQPPGNANATEDQLQGVWLIRPDGSYTTTHTYFSKILNDSLHVYRDLFEAENQPTLKKTADLDSAVYESVASGGYYNQLAADAPGDSIVKKVFIQDTGTYEVKVKIRKAVNAAKFRITIDDQPIGNELDGYSVNNIYSVVSLGTYRFDSSIVSKDKEVSARFGFKVTSKNVSSTGYRINIDYISLKKVPGAVPALTLNSALQDSMVVQQNKPFRVWGTAAPGDTIRVKPSWGQEMRTTADRKGQWKTRVNVPAAVANDYTSHNLVVNAANGSDTLAGLLIGDVWIAGGQSNMHMTMKPAGSSHNGVLNYETEKLLTGDPNLRLMTVGDVSAAVPLDEFAGTWRSSRPGVTDTFSIIAYYFGKTLRDSLGIPVGMILSAKGSTSCQDWTSLDVLTADPVLKTRFIDEKPVAPSTRYNGMIHPLLNLSVRGFIWYQGENNSGPSERGYYPGLNAAMIRGWRRDFQQGDLPFYYVQLTTSNIGASRPLEEGVALFREEQESVLDSLPNVGMAVSIDVGDTSTAHPSNKKPVGQRLALQALKKTYGRSLVYHGPKPAGIIIDADTIRVHYIPETIGRVLTLSDTGSLKHFYIGGDDKRFYPAVAKLSADSQYVNLYGVKIQSPKHVRYAFVNTALTNFYNDKGLPAYPFRTDTLNGSVIMPAHTTETRFTSGNVVVMQAGVGLPVTSGRVAPVTLRELKADGTTGAEIEIPFSGTGPDSTVRLTYNLASLGIGRSSDSSKIVIGGYDADTGAAYSGRNRVINSIDATGNIVREAAGAAAAFFPSGIRSVISNGSNFWGGGAGSGANGGIQYYGSGTPAQVSATVSSTRVVNIYGGQLYFSTGTGQPGIYTAGTGMPITSGNTAVLKFTTAGSGTGTASPYGFAFNSAGDTCYVADDRNPLSGGGVQKWAYNATAGSWVLQYTFNLITGTDTSGARQLAVDFSGARPVIYATTAEAYTNRLVKVVDAGAGSPMQLLSAAPPNAYYAGVCLSPEGAEETNNTVAYSNPVPLVKMEEEAEKQLLVYPNPAAGFAYVYLNAPLDAGCIVRLLDINGRLQGQIQATPGKTPVKLDLTGVTPGIYFVQLIQQGRAFTRKLVVQQ